VNHGLVLSGNNDNVAWPAGYTNTVSYRFVGDTLTGRVGVTPTATPFTAPIRPAFLVSSTNVSDWTQY